MAKEDEQKPGHKQSEDQRKFNQQQYDLLKRCSDKKDMTEWNEWRKKHPHEDILLENADCHGLFLKKIILSKDTSLSIHGEVYLRKAVFVNADLEDADMRFANLEGVNFNGAHLEGAKLSATHMENTNISKTYLANSEFINVHLEGANVFRTDLRTAELFRCHLQGARFQGSILDGSTLLYKCDVDRHTDFRDTGLNGARVDAGTKQLLEYNIRRLNWEEWYKQHPLLQWPVKLFWSFSDYGISTWRIIGWFFLLALAFAAIYANCACWWPPGIVNNLDVEPHLPLWHYFLLVLLRPVYFSIVTMTTLGFGDMHANEESILGHALLTLQVILGYVLLGALVTRFAVLFTAGGPAGKFAPIKIKEKREDK